MVQPLRLFPDPRPDEHLPYGAGIARREMSHRVSHSGRASATKATLGHGRQSEAMEAATSG